MIASADQEHREKVHTTNELDITERRITDTYTTAVEQLGSEKAPVRLGGLYALERLGNSTTTLRQTVVNVICAYLRMPFPLPNWEYNGPRAVDVSSDTPADERRHREELQVRLAAQSMLATHLKEPTSDPNRWGPLDIDLSDAVLVDFRLEDCSVGAARFHRSRFLVVARFDNTEFKDDAWFYEAEFERMVFLNRARFEQEAVFTRARFGWNLYARSTEFSGDLGFYQAEFCGACDFRSAEFFGSIEFDSPPLRGNLVDEIVDNSPLWRDLPNNFFNFAGATATAPEHKGSRSLPEDWHIRTDGKFVRNDP